MTFFRNECAAALLLVLTQCLVCVVVGNNKIHSDAMSEIMIGSMQIPWINRIDSVLRSTESTCTEEIKAMGEAITARETWALHMVDASSKIQSGILKGHFRDLGMYDQCVEANGRYNNTHVQGKYCTVSLSILSSAVCMPSSCNETEIAEILNTIIHDLPMISELGLEVSGVSCVLVGSEDFTIGEILTILFFSMVGAFLVSCTICEFVKKCRPAGVPRVTSELAKFSLYSNAMALLSTKVSPGMMPAIQGIRFLSTCWVVLGHAYMDLLDKPLVNLLDVADWFNWWTTAIFVQLATFAVDTFFVISGFLMSYLFLKSKQPARISDFPLMYLRRYLRLTPCFAVIMLFWTFLLHRMSTGPLWDSLDIEACRKNWWVNLLYVQNFVRSSEMCLGHSWYLAVDMQLFWISPIFLYPLRRWPKYGFGILCLLLLASVITPTVVLVINKYFNAIARIDSPESSRSSENFLHYYVPTYTRACAYFVGILLGYDVANRRRHLTQVIVAINWVVACILILICILATKRIYDSTLGYNLTLETVFSIVLRPFWSAAIAWIVYACTQGYGGPVTRFLSTPIFLPLGRLSYCIYLVHAVVQNIKMYSLRTSVRFSDFLTLNDYCGDLVLSIVAAFIISLCFESPIIILQKLLKNRGRKESPVPQRNKDLEDGGYNKGSTET